METTKLLYEKEVLLDAQVKVEENGNIRIAPLPWECEKCPIMEEDKVSYRARETLTDDGTAEIRRYKVGARPPLYRNVFETEHCSIKLSRSGRLVERWTFEKKLTPYQMYEARKREQRDVDAFFRTMNNSQIIKK